jgi:iron(II)-dependent oxidoreductase
MPAWPHDPPLLSRLVTARRETLDLIARVDRADLERSLHPEFSPLRWHFGHIAVFEGLWILQRVGGQPSLDPEFDRLFDPTRNPKPDRVHLPDLDTLREYGDRVRARIPAILAQAAPDHPDPLLRDAFVGEMIYEHECQHQEIISFLLQMIDPAHKQRPADWRPAQPGVEPARADVAVPPGTFTMGTSGVGFAYDNELKPHTVTLEAYHIDRAPVTEQAFLAFVEEGGYSRESLWTAPGWAWRQEEDARAPRDWSRGTDGSWTVRTLFEDRPPLPGYPVIGVSLHEARAFARWLGRRLPTEAEWERAAAWDPARGQAMRFPWGHDLPSAAQACSDGRDHGVRPIAGSGSSPAGCHDMAGQVWEWTDTPFHAYPSFQPFPYAGYSQDWFDGAHYVLRGGSWATRGPLCRAAFRNWYHPHVRQIFAGFRTAVDGH